MITISQKSFIACAVKLLRVPEALKGIYFARVKIYILTYKKTPKKACRLAFADLLIMQSFGYL